MVRVLRRSYEVSRKAIVCAMELLPIRSKIFPCGCNLAQELIQVLTGKVHNNDIVVITSKVVSLSEKRVISLSDIKPSVRAKELRFSFFGKGREDPRVTELVLRESEYVVPGNMLLGLKFGNFLPAAGIDLSNTEKGTAVLLPKYPWKSAWELRRKIIKEFRIRDFGLIIADSRCQPLRWGTVGIALAWAGFEGIEDARGRKDLYGRKLHVTRRALADNLASSAELLMGEADERIPFVLIRNAPVGFSHVRQRQKDYMMKPDQCIFSGLYGAIKTLSHRSSRINPRHRSSGNH